MTASGEVFPPAIEREVRKSGTVSVVALILQMHRLKSLEFRSRYIASSSKWNRDCPLRPCSTFITGSTRCYGIEMYGRQKDRWKHWKESCRQDRMSCFKRILASFTVVSAEAEAIGESNEVYDLDVLLLVRTSGSGVEHGRRLHQHDELVDVGVSASLRGQVSSRVYPFGRSYLGTLISYLRHISVDALSLLSVLLNCLIPPFVLSPALPTLTQMIDGRNRVYTPSTKAAAAMQ